MAKSKQRVNTESNRVVDLNSIRPYSGGGGNGNDMELRIAKLESDVEYIKRDISDVKGDIRDIKASATKIEVDLSEIKGQLKHMVTPFMLFSAVIGQLIGLAGIVFAMAKFINP